MNSCNGKLSRTLIHPNVHPVTKTELWTNPCKGQSFKEHPIEIGSGRYGKVYEAYCGNLFQFAIKWIPESKIRQFDKEIVLQNYVAPDYAKPIYEKLKCNGIRIDGKPDVKYGYVTDRLDVSLHSDWFDLSQEQITKAKSHYHMIFKYLFSIEPQYASYVNSVSISKLENKFNILYQLLAKKYRILFIDSGHINKHGNTIHIPILQLEDNMEQKRKKSFQFLMAMNCLDGLHNLEILHNDAHSGNIMRKIGQDKYYMIDFGRAEQFEWEDKYNPDLLFLKEHILYRMEKKRIFPVQHDTSYLLEMYDLLLPMVTYEYDIDEQTYQDTIDTFNQIFSNHFEKQVQKQLLQKTAQKEMNEIDELMEKATHKIKTFYGKRNSKKVKRKVIL